MDSKSFRFTLGQKGKVTCRNWVITVECILSDIAMGGIRKEPNCAKRYTFMLTSPAYEVSFGFKNIYGLALSTLVFINNI